MIERRVREETVPQDTHERFETTLSAIGNSEAKCLTLLCLSQTPMTSGDLHRAFMEKSGYVWKTNKTIQAHYCLESLIPNGLVEKDSDYRFRVSGKGLRYGHPVAVFLLEQSSKLPYSLLTLYGPTSRSGGETKPVLNRAKILELLYHETKTLRVVDIATQLGLKEPLVSRHLRYFSKLGLIDYSSVDPGQRDFVKHILSENATWEKIEVVGRYSRATWEVARVLFELGTVDATSVAGRIREKYPNSSSESLRHLVSRVLAGFARQGICQPERFVGHSTQSQTRISREGERIVFEVLLPVKRALAGDELLLSKWRKIAWQDYAQEGVAKYKEESGHANWRSSKEWISETLSLISQKPGVTTKEIASHLGRSPSDLLRLAINLRKVVKVKRGRATRYYPAS